MSNFHYYLQPFLVKGKCRHEIKDGTFCESEFTGPRNQKFCKEHAIQNDKNRDKIAGARKRSRARKTAQALQGANYPRYPQQG